MPVVTCKICGAELMRQLSNRQSTQHGVSTAPIT
jgi:hypothetical protein